MSKFNCDNTECGTCDVPNCSGWAGKDDEWHDYSKEEKLKFDLIVTHAGRAHRDEFLACAVALATCAEGAKVLRVNEVGSDLKGWDKCLILDIGGESDGIHILDHHQRGREEAPEFAFGLLTELVGLNDEFNLFPWMQFSRVQDAQGPMMAWKFVGLGLPKSELMSPIEEALLSMFGQQNEVIQGDWLHEAMTNIGQFLVKQAKELAASVRLMEETTQVFQIKGLTVIKVEQKDLLGLEQALKNMGVQPVVRITHDLRGDGWSLYRYNDHPSVDFKLIKDDERVAFAHAGGFIATTKEKLNDFELAELIGGAMK
jgi:hypothetical protein